MRNFWKNHYRAENLQRRTSGPIAWYKKYGVKPQRKKARAPFEIAQPNWHVTETENGPKVEWRTPEEHEYKLYVTKDFDFYNFCF